MNYICELCGAELHVEEDYRNNLPKTTYKSLIITPCDCLLVQIEMLKAEKEQK